MNVYAVTMSRSVCQRAVVIVHATNEEEAEDLACERTDIEWEDTTDAVPNIEFTERQYPDDN